MKYDLTNQYGYDVESYPNVFTCTVIRISDSATWVFESSDRLNNLNMLYHFLTSLRNLECRMVGFNNHGYDYLMLHEIVKCEGVIDYRVLYQKSKSIIDADHDDKFLHLIKRSDQYVTQLDLFLIHHFNNKAKSTSLKMLEFAMRSMNISDLPYPVGTFLTFEQIDVLIEYNKHDVKETIKFFMASLKKVEFRDSMSEKLGRDFTNHNDTKIGTDYFIMSLEQSGVVCYEGGIPRSTNRDVINLNHAIFPYVKFEQSAFLWVEHWLKNKSITKTKGAFDGICVSNQMAKFMNPELLKVKQGDKWKKLSKLAEHEKIDVLNNNNSHIISGGKDKSGLNCTVDGFSFIFGTGGIHGSVSPQVVRSDDEYALVDVDVASYYPNLAIANRLFPAHLSESFCDIYQEMYEERSQYDKKTHPSENAMLKLALNGVYGNSNNMYSPFHDPLYTMTVTLNGQLLLCMLAEQLMKIPSFTMVQINTDGLTFKLPRDYLYHMRSVLRWWESHTLLELEEVHYSAMYIRDVNNYIAEKEDGSLKRKGAYGHNRDDEGELPWNKNHSGLVIPKAAEAALVNGVPVAGFIKSHHDVMDFMMCTKVPRSSRLLHGDEQIQNVCRYVVTNDGEPLTKMMPPVSDEPVTTHTYLNTRGRFFIAKTVKQVEQAVRMNYTFVSSKTELPPERRMSIESGYNVTVCNDLSTIDKLDINYDYYIDSTNKLVEPLL